jgi:O-antigen/teichoic acid export membrane protein
MTLRRNVLAGFIGQALLLVLSLVSTRLVFRNLGDEVLGLISMALMCAMALSVLTEAGMAVLITREVASSRMGKTEYLHGVVGTFSCISWIAFLVSCVAMLLLAPAITESWLVVERLDSKSAGEALAIIAIGALTGIPKGVYGAVLSGFERIDMWNLVQVIGTGIQQLGLIILVWGGVELQALAGWFLISGFIGLGLAMAAAARPAGAGLLRPAFNMEIIRKDVRFTLNNAGIAVVSHFVSQVDKWAVSRFLPVGVLGFYGFAQAVVSKVGIAAGVMGGAAFASFSTDVGAGQETVWRSRYQKLQDLTVYLSVPLAGGATLLGIVAARFVLSQEAARMLAIPFLLLSIGHLLLYTMSVPYWLSVAMKKNHIALWANLWSVVTVLPLGIILTWSFGLTGAASSMVIYSLWQLFYFIPRFSRECAERSPWEWYARTGSFVGLGFCSYGFSWALVGVVGAGPLETSGLIAAFVLGTSAFLAGGWFLLAHDLRATARRSLKEWLIWIGDAMPSRM